jgi:hypothetical protein
MTRFIKRELHRLLVLLTCQCWRLHFASHRSATVHAMLNG